MKKLPAGEHSGRTLATHFSVARYGRAVSAAEAQDALEAARVIAELIDEQKRA